MSLRFVFRRATRFRPLVAILISMLFTALPLAAQTAGLAGRVAEPGGAPVAGATVSVGGTSLVVDTDAGGHFAFPSLRPGRYRLRIDRLGYARASVGVEVPAGTGLTILLEPHPVEVGALTVIGSPEELVEVRHRMRQVPGGVDLIESGSLRRTRQANFDDVLAFVPGVYAAPRFGAADETQLSIRGSGLRNNFHLRGVNVLVNGMPYRNADGFTDFESLELLTTDNIQVYKGGNALRFGGSTLGGAINLETKTGFTARPFDAFAQGGSFGFFKGQVSSGAVHGSVDDYVSYAATRLDGFREHSGQSRDRVNLHLGWVASPRLDIRAFYFFAHVEEDLPGSLTREEFDADPRQAVPTNLENRWGRDYSLHHFGVQFRDQLGEYQRVEVSPYVQYRDIVHPIFRVIDQISRDFGAEVRYENTAPVGGRENRLTVGFQPAWGNVDDRNFENVGGEEGDLAKDQRDEASTTAAYLEDVLAVTPRVSAVVGGRFDRARRAARDHFLDDGDQSDERFFSDFMPKVGFLVSLPSVEGQVFGNVSRSFEPPLLLELNSLTVPGFVDLKAQTAWQFEIGTRGRSGGLAWQVTGYDIELDDEILNVNVQPFPDAPFTVPTYRNAPTTRHFGIEVGGDWTAPFTLLTEANGGDRLGVHLAYTFNRFTYVEDPDYAGNDLPGAPDHHLVAELTYSHPSGLTLRPNVEWVPGSYFVDSANTVENDGWTVFGLRSEFALSRIGGLVFVEARNLTDESYSPAVTVDDAAGRFFLPADGRALYAGIQIAP